MRPHDSSRVTNVKFLVRTPTKPTKRPPTNPGIHLIWNKHWRNWYPLINKPSKLSTAHSQLIPALSDYPKYWPLCVVKTDFAAAVQNSFCLAQQAIFRQTWICLLNMLGKSDPKQSSSKMVVKDGDDPMMQSVNN